MTAILLLLMMMMVVVVLSLQVTLIVMVVIAIVMTVNDYDEETLHILHFLLEYCFKTFLDFYNIDRTLSAL